MRGERGIQYVQIHAAVFPRQRKVLVEEACVERVPFPIHVFITIADEAINSRLQVMRSEWLVHFIRSSRFSNGRWIRADLEWESRGPFLAQPRMAR
jgi:hypothetical protein